MTIDQLVIVLNWLINLGIPILVALITRAEATPAVKALTSLGLSLLSTALVAIVVDLSSRHSVDWFSIIFAFVTGFIVSAVSYMHIWKPTGVAPTVAQYGVTSKADVETAA